jgi:sugar diacid utilization regulator
MREVVVSSQCVPQQVPAANSRQNGVVPGADRDVLRAIALRVSDHLEAICTRMVERYREEIVDYKLVDDHVLYNDVYKVSLDALRVTVANLESGRRPTIEELDGTRAGAARRVHQDVSLESFLHALRLWGQLLWETVLACADEEVPAEREAALQIAGMLLEHLDLHSIAATQGYLDELQNVWSDREMVRRDVLDALIAGDGDAETVRRLAKSLRLRLHENYVVVIVRGDECPSEETPERPLPARIALRRIVEAARKRLRPAVGSVLVGMRHGEVVALYPFEDAEELETIKRSSLRLADDLEGRGVSIGISSSHKGLAQLALSYSEAKEAVEIAVKAGSSGRVIAFDDVLIDSIIRSSRHAERIVDSTIAPLLSYDAIRQAELVPTLRAYVEAGFNVTKAAETLCVHPNTVVYRLGRIKELTGRDPHGPDDLLLLYLGLKLIELSPQE